MKIFSQTETISTKENSPSKKVGKGKKHEEKTDKKAVSEGEIREKLAAHVETSNTAKSQVLKQNSKALGAGFMNEDLKPRPIIEADSDIEGKKQDSVKDSHLLLSDVQLNDPKDSNTQEKLKSVLKNGAFNFNPREKETLEKILSGN